MPKLTTLAALVPALMAMSAGVAYAVDTGDAPITYGTASHNVVDGASFLGRRTPDNNEPVAGLAADGDGEDEDGVFAFPELVQNGKAFTTNVFATNPGTTPATLVGWIDFDGNGRFDADEAASTTVPAGSDNAKFKLVWNDLTGVTTDFSGDTFSRFRISTDPLTGANAEGEASDGEVEDYTLTILDDVDGDEVPDVRDLDNDNDGIPDEVEVIGVDTDGDGTPNYLDTDSDNDLVPDFVEAGLLPATPADTDGDGTPDYLDLDSNNDGTLDETRITDDADGDGITSDVEGNGDADGDGVPNTDDLDSDNDLIPDAVEVGRDATAPIDSDGDGIFDFLDLDSDNDGVPDLYEATGFALNVLPFDADGDGRADANRSGGVNGLDDAAETEADSGVPMFAVADSDGDGTRDYLDADSDNDGVLDVIEAGLTDGDANGLVDTTEDANGDGLADSALSVLAAGTGLPDTDTDGVPDFRDADAIGGDGTGTAAPAPVEGGTETPAPGGDTDGAPVVEGDTDGDTDGETNGEMDGETGGNTGGEPVSNGSGDVVVGGDMPETVDGSEAPRDDASSPARIETGLTGYGGCTIDATGARDPLLPGLALATLLIAGVRRKTVGNR